MSDQDPESPPLEGIAVVGLSGRFPGAADLAELWRNLCGGIESITFHSREELEAAGVPPALLDDPRYVRASASLCDVQLFDADFFGFSAREAELMDPQQRIFLECCWEALEHAGYDTATYPGTAGIFAGMGMSGYLMRNLLSHPGLIYGAGPLQVRILNDVNYLASLAAFKLDLRGPSVTVQTACSTSLVAVCMACQSLLQYQCDLVLAGGVTVAVPHAVGYLAQEGVMSPDGHCRAFDADAHGTVEGSGAGVVVLKRLADAVAEGDTIHAVIKGFATNNDGGFKLSFTAPSLDGQVEAVATALAVAGVPAESITYVEAHGTGTPLGDPVEVAALTEVFAASTDRRGFCALGSIKTNIGHLDAAAGVAGLIKAILAVEHGVLPPSLHFETPNPRIDFARSPFYVNTECRPWNPEGWPRRAGVSAFAIGGVNAHVVVEEPPSPAPSAPAPPWQLLVLSARTETALDAVTGRLLGHLREQPESDLADVAYTLQTGRRAFSHRRMLVCRDLQDAAGVLERRDPRRLLSGTASTEPQVAFLFSGLGNEYAGMARGLYRDDAGFRARIDECAAGLAPLLGVDLREILFPEGEEPGQEGDGGIDLRGLLGRSSAASSSSSSAGEAADRRLRRTVYSQPAVFAVEYALASRLMDWGIRPQAMVGFSIGEYVAACLAGVLSLEDALRLVAGRALLIDALPAGAMLAVPLGEEAVAPWLADPSNTLSLAAVAGTELTVLAGTEEAVAAAEERLTAAGHLCRRLQTGHAFHSALMEPVVDRFLALFSGIELRPPAIPYLSNVTGGWITAEQATDPAYWADHLRGTVRFAGAVAELWREPGRVLLEIGPGQTLGSWALQHPAAADVAEPVALPTLRHAFDRTEDLAFLLHSVGRLWLTGQRLDGAALFDGAPRRRVPLPTYPFERSRHWIDPGTAPAVLASPPAAAAQPLAPPPATAAAAAPRRQYPRPNLHVAYAPPRDATERRLVEILGELLRLERVGIYDSFFDLGGDSLLATHLVARLNRELGAELTLRAIFEAPAAADLAVNLAPGSAAARPVDGGDAWGPLARRTADTPPPLSFAQRRLWFLDRLEPGSPLYNIAAAVALTGRLEVPALAAALAAIVARHETLRTTFGVDRNREPVQIIAPRAEAALPVIDLAGLPAVVRKAEAERITAAEARQPFDLARGPLLRTTLVALAPAEHLALVTQHHIVSDGWSMGVLVGELGALYAACRDGRPSPLPELAVQYADFAEWERRRLSGAFLEPEIAWWRERLAGMPPALELPADHPRPAARDIAGAVHEFRIGRAEVARLAALSRGEGATLFMTLLAGLLAVLGRTTGSRDLVVGTPVAGRLRPETEPLIGLFVNTLVLRTSLAGDPDFATLLGRVRETALAAYDHQEVPFERLVEELAPERDLSRPPLAQVVLALHNAPAGPLELPGLALSTTAVHTGTAKFELTCLLTESEGALEGALEYSRRLFDGPTIERLARRFTRLLAAIVTDPRAPLASLSLLEPGERHQILLEWNDTRAPFPAETLLHQFFEAAADRSPRAVAAVCGGLELTYGELEARANCLAHRLRNAGVGRGAPVGVWTERSFAMLTAVLGVLKAGGHYVALDEAWPAERVEAILSSTGALAIVTGSGLLAAAEEMQERLPALSGVVCLDASGDLIGVPDDLPSSRLPAVAGPDDLAYVIHTSGSTGEPKGIVVQHRPAANLIDWINRTFEVGEADRGLFVASLCFDLSVYDIFGLLAAGGTVHVASRDDLADPGRLVELLCTGGITLWDSAPAALVQLAPLFPPEPEPGSRLRQVLLSGDWIPVTLPDRVRRAFPGARVQALGGATEATVWSNWFPLDAGDVVDPAWPSIPYGRPIANARYHVLDAGFSPCPVGVPGDLFIGGGCLCLGYSRPELTAGAFLPDPFADEPGARLYRTGDRARYFADGNLEFLGRVDHQVKIRGYRIELGEIEVALARLPAVREAVVLVREDEPGDRRLVAYVVPAPELGPEPPNLAPGALRDALRRSLPDYMLPVAFVQLAALPVTPNGKLDRAVLPAPARAAAAGGDAPETPAEKTLAAIWEEVLGVPAVGREDSFFELGGHSLRATQLVARLREVCGAELPLRILFERPVLADLAAWIEGEIPETERAPGAAIPRISREGALPLSFAQQRLWFIDRLEPGSPLYNIPVALRVEGPLDRTVLARCLGEIVRRHEALRTVFTEAAGAPVQEIRPAAPFVLPMVDLSGLPAADREPLILALAGEEAGLPFDLARGPLLRGVLVRLHEADHLLALTMHHIVSDAWSMGILVREMAALYAAFAASRPSPLPEPPVQYADFAAWQRARLHGDMLDAEVAFWRCQLADLPPLLELPADRPRPARQSYRGATRPVRLPAGLALLAQELGRREGATLFMVLLAAFQVLLARLSGQADLAVGSPAAGRDRVETEGLIGFFVNTLVLRGDLSDGEAGAPTFRELLARVRETALAVQAHQDLPFEKLVEELSPARSLAHTPLFQVMLALQNVPLGALEIEGVHMRPVDAGGMTAKFDLTLTLIELDGELEGTIEYATDLFDAATVERWMRRFTGLLAAAVAAPERPAALLPLLTAGERQQLLAEWNDTETPQPDGMLLHGLFEIQAARTPAAPAVTFAGETLTYAELDARAGRLADRLRALGCGPESRVGIALERSLALPVALLAVLKTGAAYVPLDPGFPRERLAFMLADAAPRVLIAETPLLAAFPPAPGAVLCLDRPAESLDGPAVPAAAGYDDRQLAYVLYTSGSTGRPKGVGVPHRAVVNFLESMRRAPGFRPGERLLAVTSLGFDIAALEIFLPLTTGGAVEIASRSEVADGVLLAARLRASRAGALQATPATWRLLRDSGWPGDPDLVALCGGEALPPDLAAFLAGATRELWNLYGPTETTIWSAAGRIRPGETGRISIGRPIANTRIHLFDRHLETVPPGAPGELWIGGAGLARGYLGRPDLTAERFVPDPLATGRLYKTGDLARWLPDGRLEVLGRLDHQVKVRGFRIELGEIEAALAARPGVRESVVVAREDRSGSRRLVAYVAGEVSDASVDALRQGLRERLPDYMLPAAFVVLPALPLTPNGKIDRKALPAPGRSAAEAVRQVPESTLEKAIAAVWQEVLESGPVGVDDNFFDRGGHSLLLVQVQSRLGAELGREIKVADLFAYPTVASLARFLAQGESREATRSAETRQLERWRRSGPAGEDGVQPAVAIIGMAGRFPGAADLDSFWELLRDGREAVTFFSDEELLAAGADPALLASPDYVKAGAVLADADLFDAAFFDISPREAELLDPQQRVLLECAAEALESSGYAGTSRPAGVFVGASDNSYFFNNLATRPDLAESAGQLAVNLASSANFVATRLSYELNLSGASLTVQTACSTSLTAVHLACQSLLAGDCELALAGGVSVRSPQKSGYLYQPAGIMSPDGHCRAFDARGAGTLGGQGVGLVVLKLLSDALDDGDTIHAVIRGTGLTNDGLLKAGFTAPGLEGQSRAIRTAHLRAGVEPGSIGYVETHGTATPLGDVVEIAALTRAFRMGTERSGFCAIGSVKTNIGHLDAAAGIAGLLKTVLALEHGQIPPSLHFSEPNPQIEFAASPFFVNTGLRDWPHPRRAGVSSFGLGGTNAHAVLEEAPPAEPSGPSRPWQVLLVSAHTPEALDRATDNLAARLEADPALSLADVAHTLRTGRWTFAHRRAVVAAGTGEAAAALRSRDPQRVWTAVHEPGRRPVAFLLPGVGDQYPGIARGLYEDEPAFRREIDLCADLLLPHLGLDLREALFSGREAEPSSLRSLLGRGPKPAGLLQETRIAQPAMFAVGYALARLWMSWGVEPQALVGYSLGEYTAACVAGVMALPDALVLVARRARLIGELAPGAMLAVPLSEEETRARLGDPSAADLSLAAVNAPVVSVVAGTPEAVAALESRLAGEGIPSRRLQTAQAFHSRLMQPAAQELLGLVRSIPLAPPRIPYLSNVTGTWVEAEQATDPAYWVRHLLSTVRFADSIAELWREPGRVLLEMGPGQTLGSLALQQIPAGGGADHAVFSSLRHALDPQPDQRFLLQTAGRLWLAGAEIDWSAFRGDERRRRVPLPAYPFERRRFWVEPGKSQPLTRQAAPGAPERLADMAAWFHTPSWKRSPRLRPTAAVPTGRWLVLLDALGLGESLAERLAAAGCEVATARVDRAADLDAVLAGLGEMPERIVHLWSLTPPGEPADVGETVARGYQALISLAQALAKRPEGGPAEICVIANGLCDVEREDPLHPEKATLLGPLRVIPQEHPGISCRLIDIDVREMGPDLEARLLAEIAEPPAPSSAAQVTAWRGPHRWSPVFEPAPLAPVAGRAVLLEGGLERHREPSPPTPLPSPSLPPGEGRHRPSHAVSKHLLKQSGTYLITGGLGGLGLALAGHLWRTAGARLVLTGRSALPAAGTGGGGDAELERRLREVAALEAAGAEVLTLAADVTDEAAMRRAVEAARQRFGHINGVFHAAGVPGAGLLQLKTRETAPLALAPKVQGTLVLDAVLAADPPDFLVLFSSLHAVLGGVGQAETAAADAFLGAFARDRALRDGMPVIAVDWSEWRWDRWTEERVADAGLRERLRRRRETAGLTFAEGLEALDRILESGLPEVLVSPLDLAAAVSPAPALDAFLGEVAELAAAAPVRKGHPRPALQTPWAAPSTATEERMAALWGELLGIDGIGANDNFFELGGHSLTGTQLIARLRHVFGADLPLRALFVAPTVAGLSAEVDARRRLGGAPERPALTSFREDREMLPPLSFAQERFWAGREAEARSLAPNTIPIMLMFEGDLDVALLRGTLQAVVDRHEAMRTCFRSEPDGRPVQIVLPALRVDLPVIDLADIPADGRMALIDQWGQHTTRLHFDYERAPLFRLFLFRYSPREHVLFAVLHHITFDGWSSAILTAETAALYNAFRTGAPSPLPPLPAQYQDFARWQRQTVAGEALERQVSFWREHLAGAMPLDLSNRSQGRPPQPDRQTQEGGIKRVVIFKDLERKLEAFAAEQGVTLFMTLLAAFSVLLAGETGRDDFVIVCLFANRDNPDVEGMIGNFYAGLPLRIRPAGLRTFRELLEQVRDVTLAAHEHPDILYERVFDGMSFVRPDDPGGLSTFRVLFQLSKLPDTGQGELEGLRIRRLPFATETMRADLSLFLFQEARLSGRFRYNRDVVAPEIASRLRDRFIDILTAVVESADCPLAELAGQRADHVGVEKP